MKCGQRLHLPNLWLVPSQSPAHTSPIVVLPGTSGLVGCLFSARVYLVLSWYSLMERPVGLGSRHGGAPGRWRHSRSQYLTAALAPYRIVSSQKEGPRREIGGPCWPQWESIQRLLLRTLECGEL
jgi:hypothetical protein